MKLYLLDSNRYMTEAWKKTFQYQNVEIVTGDFQVFIKEYKPEAIVAPGNSFGIMDGGLDLEIRNYFGMKAQEDLQKKNTERLVWRTAAWKCNDSKSWR